MALRFISRARAAARGHASPGNSWVASGVSLEAAAQRLGDARVERMRHVSRDEKALLQRLHVSLVRGGSARRRQILCDPFHRIHHHRPTSAHRRARADLLVVCWQQRSASDETARIKLRNLTEKGDHPDVRLGLEGRVGAREGLDCAEAIRKVVEAPAEDELVQCAPKRRRLRAANGASVSRERPRKRWVQGFAHSQS